MPDASPRQLTVALRRLGLTGVLLLAGVLCDLVIIVAASFDGVGSFGSEVWLLPGIVALSACALKAPVRPKAAAWAGAGVLMLSTALLRVTGTVSYTALLEDITFAETVAGVELLYFCVRCLRPVAATGAALALVSATVVAVVIRTDFWLNRSMVVPTVFAGGGLLLVTVFMASHARGPASERESGRFATLLRQQWPVVGMSAAALFLEMFYAATDGTTGMLVLACSALSALAALIASHRPTPGAISYAALVLVAGALVRFGDIHHSYALLAGVPLTQIVTGMAVVVFCVRNTGPRRASSLLGLLTGVVGIVSLVNVLANDPEALRPLFVAALLLFGISVAIGMYLRARDSERTRAVATAVSDAQTAERMALARELHDVVAHHVTGIVVQAQAARMLAEQNPRVVVDALGQIEKAGTDAMTAMRRLVRSMRGDAPAGASEFSERATTDLAADLRRLVETNNHGVPTELDLDVSADLPPEVTRSALRLVQESLTNVGKHAEGATGATVTVCVRDAELRISVRDNGTSAVSGTNGAGGSRGPAGTGQRDRPAEDSGYGLIGMRERVELLHGRLSAGPCPQGGWLVRAWLPITGEAERKDGR